MDDSKAKTPVESIVGPLPTSEQQDKGGNLEENSAKNEDANASLNDNIDENLSALTILETDVKEIAPNNSKIAAAIGNLVNVNEEKEAIEKEEKGTEANNLIHPEVDAKGECHKSTTGHSQQVSSKPQEIRKQNSKISNMQLPTEDAKSSSVTQKKNMKNANLPSDKLVEKIISISEFYLSDFSIFKSNYIYKRMQRNKEGFIHVKVIASNRKLRSLTKDLEVIVYSLEKSKNLELNPEKTKVRRLVPLPKIEETSYGKTVLVFNLPSSHNLTPENLVELFAKFGNIVSAEVMTPRSEDFNVYHSRCLFYNEEASSQVFGQIEFENFEDAVGAVKDKDSHLPKENQVKVVPLLTQLNFSGRQRPRSRQRNQFAGKFNRRARYQSDYRNGFQENRICEDCKKNLVRDEKIRQSSRSRYPETKGNPGANPTPENHGKIQSQPGYYRHNDLPNSPWFPRRELRPSNTMNIGRAAVIQRNPKKQNGQSCFQENRVK